MPKGQVGEASGGDSGIYCKAVAPNRVVPKRYTIGERTGTAEQHVKWLGMTVDGILEEEYNRLHRAEILRGAPTYVESLIEIKIEQTQLYGDFFTVVRPRIIEGAKNERPPAPPPRSTSLPPNS